MGALKYKILDDCGFRRMGGIEITGFGQFPLQEKGVTRVILRRQLTSERLCNFAYSLLPG